MRGIQDNRGSALIVTLLLVSILTGLVVDFVYEVYIDSSALSNWTNAQKASLIAKSGVNLSTEMIADVKEMDYTDERVVDMPVEHDFGPGISLSVTMEDENSKLNVNSIIYDRGNDNVDALNSLKRLMEYLNINPDMSLIIADWIDPDSEPRVAGAEDSAKNDRLWSIDELKLIEGITNETYDKIIPYVTIFGGNNINLNTAELPVLMVLHSDMTETLAQNIIEYRESYPFDTGNSIYNVSGMEGKQIISNTTYKASTFRITSQATVNDITRIVESIVDSSMKIHFWREI